VNLRGTRAPSHHDGSVASPPPSPAQSEEPTTPSPQQGGFASRPRPILLPQDSGQASPAPRKSVSMRVLESAGEPSARSAAGSTRRMSTLLKRAVSSLALTTPTAREYSHASLNEHMLTKSLTRSIRDRHWRAVALISTGWALNLTCFLGLLFVFVLYGCELFSTDQTTASGEPADWRALLISWGFSVFQRFVVNEPMLILVSKGMPILFTTEFCANVCGETVVNLLDLMVQGIVTCIKEIKTG